MRARTPGSRIAVALIAASALALVAAPAATADVEVFTVDSTADTANAVADGVCDAPGADTCTLREALREADDGDPVTDTDSIGFSAPLADLTIQTGSILTGTGASDIKMDEPTTINGCSVDPFSPRPCVGIRGPDTNTDAFQFSNGADVTIKGLAFTNVDRGVAALALADGLTVQNNWFGIKVDGTDEAIRQGVQVTADDAVIGGTDGVGNGSTIPATRNVFANATVGSGVGLGIFVADDAQVLGNYFGTNEQGTAVAANDDDITIGGNNALQTSTGTVIGGTQTTPGTCDGACNVISGATVDGIDLRGDAPHDAASTTITGNFIGLNAAGTAAIPNITGIRVVNAPDTTIGGVAGLGNQITGGDTAITSLFQGAPDLAVTGNLIGLNSAGTAALSPPKTGVSLNSLDGFATSVTGNVIATDPTTGVDGIHAQGDDASIVFNFIGVTPLNAALVSGGIGIRAVNLDGATINQNTVGNMSLRGLALENSDSNVVTANLIGTDAASGDQGNTQAGIQITDVLGATSTQNTIGGDLSSEANVISNNGGDAIEVEGDGNDGNVIARNTGGQNGQSAGDLFIDLVGADGNGNGATGPNGGIEPPFVLAHAAARSVGLSAAGATVRVSNFGFGVGNLQSSLGTPLGQATADSRGLWQLNHSPAATDGVAATQTTASGTSESDRLASLAPGGGSAPGVGLSGPSGATSDSTPSFTMSDPTGDTDFEIFVCATDAGLYEPCGIPGSEYTTDSLPDGAHLVIVTAIDSAGNVSAPVTRSFTVDTVAPSTTITKSPKKKVRSKKRKKKVTFKFVSSEPGAGGFQCQIDSKPFVLCNGGSFTRKLKRGKHTFRVRAFDAAANPDPTLAVKSFRILRPKRR